MSKPNRRSGLDIAMHFENDRQQDLREESEERQNQQTGGVTSTPASSGGYHHQTLSQYNQHIGSHFVHQPADQFQQLQVSSLTSKQFHVPKRERMSGTDAPSISSDDSGLLISAGPSSSPASVAGSDASEHTPLNDSTGRNAVETTSSGRNHLHTDIQVDGAGCHIAQAAAPGDNCSEGQSVTSSGEKSKVKSADMASGDTSSMVIRRVQSSGSLPCEKETSSGNGRSMLTRVTSSDPVLDKLGQDVDESRPLPETSVMQGIAEEDSQQTNLVISYKAGKDSVTMEERNEPMTPNKTGSRSLRSSHSGSRESSVEPAQIVLQHGGGHRKNLSDGSITAHRRTASTDEDSSTNGGGLFGFLSFGDSASGRFRSSAGSSSSGSNRVSSEAEGITDSPRQSSHVSTGLHPNASSSDLGSLNNSVTTSDYDQSFERARDILTNYDSPSRDLTTSSLSETGRPNDLLGKGSNGHVSDGGSRAGSETSSYISASNKSGPKTSSEKKKKSTNWYNAKLGDTRSRLRMSSESISSEDGSYQSVDGLHPQFMPHCDKRKGSHHIPLKLRRGSIQPSTLSERRSTLKQYVSVLSPTYKSRSEDFKRIFKDIPNEERLIVDYSCALQKDILVHGRLYVTQNWICFYANIFRWETVLTLKCKEITAMTKEKTARVIPNAIAITTNHEKFFFTSFGARDKTFLMLFRVWQNALMDQPMSAQELWQWVHLSYGDELGLTSSDDDYVSPTGDEELLASPLPLYDGVVSPEARIDKSHKRLSVPLHLLPRPANASLDTSTNDEDNVEDDGMLNGDLSMSNSATTPPSDKNTSSYTADNLSLNTSSVDDQGTLSSDKVPNHLKVPSPDATSGGELPTDLGDTSEDSEGEVACSGHDHNGFTALDEIFQISVDQMFELLFTDSDFNKGFLKERKTFDIVNGPWPDDADTDGNKRRTITYTLSLNYSVGPKVAPTTEKQVCYGHNKPGVIHVVDTETVNHGIPYGDNFYVATRYCITRVSLHKCRLRVNCEIKYRKNVWGLVKNFIEKNATQGILENFTLLSEHLRREQERQALMISGQPLRKKVLRRRRGHSHSNADRTPSLKRSEGKQSSTIPPALSSRLMIDDLTLKLNSSSVARVICAIVILLVLVNAILFYKLCSLESRASLLFYSQADFRHVDDQVRSHEEWVQLLEQQQHLHDQEIERWKDVLGSSVQLMQQMKLTLEELHQSIEQRSRFMLDLRGKKEAH